MVERLKAAIEKARASRAGAPPSPPAGAGEPGSGAVSERIAPGAPASGEPDPWLALEAIRPDPQALVRERIVTRDKSDPSHVAFDALRTRLLKALSDNGWFRVAVTSPNKGCGKTMVAANLAFSLARQPETRSMLIDLDLRVPQLAERLDQRGAHTIEPYLAGEISPRDYFCRIGANLAVGLNTVRVRNPSELIQGRRAARAFTETWEMFHPNIVLFDTPPMLSCDDVLALLPNIDGVLLVIGGGQTRAGEIEECERLMSEHTNFLGVVLNKADDAGTATYRYYEN